MDGFFKIEQKGKGGKSRWNVWRYRVVNGLEVRANDEPENERPFQRYEDARAFLKRLAPNQLD
jgi:hypothetical protein